MEALKEAIASKSKCPECGSEPRCEDAPECKTCSGVDHPDDKLDMVTAPAKCPCKIIEADFATNTLTLEMQGHGYRVSARTHWLCEEAPILPLTQDHIANVGKPIEKNITDTDRTLHGGIDYWQTRALDAEEKLGLKTKDLTTLVVETRHPGSYVLLNEQDGTYWRGTEKGNWISCQEEKSESLTREWLDLNQKEFQEAVVATCSVDRR